jgi:hypothetical protein
VELAGARSAVASTADTTLDIAARMAAIGFTGIGDNVSRLSVSVQRIGAALAPEPPAVSTGVTALATAVHGAGLTRCRPPVKGCGP